MPRFSKAVLFSRAAKVVPFLSASVENARAQSRLTRRVAASLLSSLGLLGTVLALPAAPAVAATAPTPPTITAITASLTDGTLLGTFHEGPTLSTLSLSSCTITLAGNTSNPEPLRRWFDASNHAFLTQEVFINYYTSASSSAVVTLKLINAWPEFVTFSPQSTAYGVKFVCSSMQQVAPTTRGSTSANLSGSASSAPVGTSVTFAANVSPVSAWETVAFTTTGTVAFRTNGTVIPGCLAVPLDAHGTATCTAATLTVGTHTITAEYVPVENLGWSSSASALTETITKASSSASVSCAPNAVVFPGGQTTCTATVTGSRPTPTGQVSFDTSGNGGFSAGGCTLSANHCSVTYTPGSADVGVGAVITGRYSGDVNNTGSEGKTTLTVTKGA